MEIDTALIEQFIDSNEIDNILIVKEENNIQRQQQDNQIESIKYTPKDINRKWYQDHTALFYIFSLILILYAFIRWRYEEYLLIIKRSILNKRVSQIYFDEFQNQFIIPTMLLYFNTILAFGITFYFFFKQLNYFINQSFWQQLAYCIGLSILFFVLKYGIQRIMTLILPITENLKFYLFNKFHIQILLGILLIPLLILLSFTNFIPSNLLLWIIGLVICIITIFQLYRGFQINMKLVTLYPFHFFLYLCALELTPILIIYTFHRSSFI